MTLSSSSHFLFFVLIIRNKFYRKFGLDEFRQGGRGEVGGDALRGDFRRVFGRQMGQHFRSAVSTFRRVTARETSPATRNISASLKRPTISFPSKPSVTGVSPLRVSSFSVCQFIVFPFVLVFYIFP